MFLDRLCCKKGKDETFKSHFNSFSKKNDNDDDLNSWKAFMSISEIENTFLTDFLLCRPIS